MNRQSLLEEVNDYYGNNNNIEKKNLKENDEDTEVSLKFPYEIKPIDPELNNKLLKDFTGERTSFVQIGPKKWFFINRYAEDAEKIYNFKVRSDDVFIVTFPRSGTTWTQEMIWLLCNNLDYEKAAKYRLVQRFPFLEYSSTIHPDVKKEFLMENIENNENYELIQLLDYPRWTGLADQKDRRFIKSHLPFSLLPPDLLKKGCKVIYVARNPKDVAVSFYHLCKNFRTLGYQGDFEKFWHYFKNNLVHFSPYWEHIKEAWNLRHNDNFLFLYYENINQNLKENVKKLAQFLEKSYTEEEYDHLTEHLKFDNFKKNKSVAMDHIINLDITNNQDNLNFIRKGKNGDHKNYFNKELEKEADQWIEENLKGTDIKFPVFD